MHVTSNIERGGGGGTGGGGGGGHNGSWRDSRM